MSKEDEGEIGRDDIGEDTARSPAIDPLRALTSGASSGGDEVSERIVEAVRDLNIPLDPILEKTMTRDGEIVVTTEPEIPMDVDPLAPTEDLLLIYFKNKFY